MPEQDGASFAFIYSIDDPHGGTPSSGMGVQVGWRGQGYARRLCASRCPVQSELPPQVMGPKDTYIIQQSRNVSSFWASKTELELGNVFA